MEYMRLMMSTREVTNELKAPPIITPTAKSIMLPFKANSLNSFNIIIDLLFLYYKKKKKRHQDAFYVILIWEDKNNIER